MAGLDCVEHRAERYVSRDLECNLAAHLRQRAERRGEHHTDHACVHESVCTSTESTAGKSCTIGAQLSPESLDTYTCPPVVPK